MLPSVQGLQVLDLGCGFGWFCRWARDEHGRKTWPVNRYFMEGSRTTDWLGHSVLKYHRTLTTTLRLLREAQFSLDRAEEFCPTAAPIAARPTLADELERPMFLLICARRMPDTAASR